jgi:hypothetical protein
MFEQSDTAGAWQGAATVKGLSWRGSFSRRISSVMSIVRKLRSKDAPCVRYWTPSLPIMSKQGRMCWMTRPVPGVSDERRIAPDGRLVVTRTRDGGKSFEMLRSGLPQEHAYDIVLRHALAVDSSGQSLAFGSTTGGLWVSEDQGDNWHCVSHTLPPIYAVRFAAA